MVKRLAKTPIVVSDIDMTMFDIINFKSRFNSLNFRDYFSLSENCELKLKKDYGYEIPTGFEHKDMINYFSQIDYDYLEPDGRWVEKLKEQIELHGRIRLFFVSSFTTFEPVKATVTKFRSAIKFVNDNFSNEVFAEVTPMATLLPKELYYINSKLRRIESYLPDLKPSDISLLMEDNPNEIKFFKSHLNLEGNKIWMNPMNGWSINHHE